MSYRFSSLSKYEQCPAAYWAMIQGLPTLDAAIMQDGSKAHEVYEAYAQHCLASGLESDISAMPEIAGGLGVLPGSALYATLIAPWLERGHLFQASRIIGIEEHLAIDAEGRSCMPSDPDAWLHGTIDLLEAGEYGADEMTIRDYKTGFNTEANALQMEIYSLLTLAAYTHVSRVVCEFDYTRFNIQKRTTVTRDSIENILSRVRGIVNAIEADEENRARPGEHCMTCQWRHGCAAVPVCATTIRDVDTARQAVEAISLLQRDLENQKDMLRAWCVQNGPVSHNGVVWALHQQGEDGFDDAKTFADACAAAGVAPWPYLSVSNTAARKLRKRGEWPKPLEAILVNRRSVAFRAKKEKGE